MIPQISTPYKELQTAIVARLAANGNTSGYTVYDGVAVPASATFPYITMERFSGGYEGATNLGGWDMRAEVRVIDRDEKARASRQTTYDMMADVVTALTASQIGTTGEWTLWDGRPEFSELMVFEDETYIYLQGILRFRFRIQYRTPTTTGAYMITQAGAAMGPQ